MKKTLPLVMSALVLTVTASNAQVYVDDDFESYADTPGMQVVWGAAGLGTLGTTNGFGGSQGMVHPGGTDNTYALGADLIPTDANPVVLSGKIYDDGAGNKRLTIGLRSLNTFPLFEMGFYNSDAGEGYYSRVTLFPGGVNPSWVSLGAGPSVAGWHTFEAIFTGSDITVTLDLGSDSVIDATQVTALGGAYADGLGVVRLGGPSSLSSAGGGGVFDDIYLAQVPEPTTFALGALGLLTLGVFRRTTR